MEKEDLNYYLKKQRLNTKDESKYIGFDELNEGYYKVNLFP